MRDFTKQGRSLAIGDRGMICTSHPAASMAGLEMLRSGGNSVDAAITAIAVHAVAEPQMTGIGGDCFALFSMRGAPPTALDGSGRAPGAATAEWYVDRGIRQIPPTSAHAVTIPGAISAWCTLNKDYGSKPLSEVLAPNSAQGWLSADRPRQRQALNRQNDNHPTERFPEGDMRKRQLRFASGSHAVS